MISFLPRLAAWAATGATCAALMLALSSGTSVQAQKPTPGADIDIHAESILFDRDHPRQARYGKLEWLGTLRLTSPSPDFGGYSGLELDASGTRMIAISDTGTWLRATLVYRNSRMEKLTGARIGAIRGLGDKPLPTKFYQDAEGFALTKPGQMTGTAYISFERKHRIALHRVTAAGIGPALRLLKLPARARSAKDNQGLEGIAVLRGGPSKGALVAFTEEYLDKGGDHIGWLIGGPKPGALRLERIGGFAVTDLASTPNGDLIVLERRFRFSEGVKLRLRRVRAKDIRAGARLRGEVLLESDELREIDNMEGLAIHSDKAGRTILTLISDDNFNHTFQRTLLMQFALAE